MSSAEKKKATLVIVNIILKTKLRDKLFCNGDALVLGDLSVDGDGR